MDRIIELRSEWTDEEQRRWDKIMEDRGLANDDTQGTRLTMAVDNVSHILYNGKTRPIYISAKWFWFKVHKYVWIYTCKSHSFFFTRSYSFLYRTNIHLVPKAERKKQDTAFNGSWDADNSLRAGASVQLGEPGELASYHYLDYVFRQKDAEKGVEPMPRPSFDADEEHKEDMIRNWPGDDGQVIPWYYSWPSENQRAQTHEKLFPGVATFPGCGYFELPAPPMENWARCLGNDWSEAANTLHRASEMLGGRYDLDVGGNFPIQLRMDLRGRDKLGEWKCTLKLGWDAMWLNPDSVHGQFLIKMAWRFLQEYMALEGYGENCSHSAESQREEHRVRGLAERAQAYVTAFGETPQSLDHDAILGRIEQCRERRRAARAKSALPVQLIQKSGRVHRKLLQQRAEDLSKAYATGLLEKVAEQSPEERKASLLEWVSAGTLTEEKPFHGEGLRSTRRLWAAPLIQTLLVDFAKAATKLESLSDTISAWKEMVMCQEGTRWGVLMPDKGERLLVVRGVATEWMDTAPAAETDRVDVDKALQQWDESFHFAMPDWSQMEALDEEPGLEPIYEEPELEDEKEPTMPAPPVN